MKPSILASERPVRWLLFQAWLFIPAARRAQTVTVYWQYPSTCWQLQQNPDLTTTNWTSTAGITNDGTNNLNVLPMTTGHMFFRLKMR